MAFDMEQFRRIFYQECRENLEIFERELLTFELENDDDNEQINAIFRAAHSIKGGAVTFDLIEVSQFTHVMETLLDEARVGLCRLDQETIDLLLKSGDCISAMLNAFETAESFDTALRNELSAALIQALSAGKEADAQPETETISRERQGNLTPQNVSWMVIFKPFEDLFFSGNDPLRILRELQMLDPDAVTHCNHQKLVKFDEFVAEACYLSWTIYLNGSLEAWQIKEVFEWVGDECELIIQRENVQEVEASTIDHEIQAIDENQNEEDASAETYASPASCEKPVMNQSVDNNRKSLPSSSQPSNSLQRKTLSAKQDSVSSIRVDIDKIDNLINLVGELVITQSMLTELGQDSTENKLEQLQQGLDQLLQNTKELQHSVLNIRMLPISVAFNRFPRLIRDLSFHLQKEVELVIEGEKTELDKTVLERISDPLTHLVRNAIDHGLEATSVRREKGKASTGKITLKAFHQGGVIVIEVIDDGAGLNREKIWLKASQKQLISYDFSPEMMTDAQVHQLIFLPGFSTADQVSDISGRGVGMDVVKRNIEELGGFIDVHSVPNEGCVFRISLPLTLTILDGQLVKCAEQVFVVPLLSIVESIQIRAERVKFASGGVELYCLHDENVPILRLKEEFDLGQSGPLDKQILCLVEAGGKRVGLLLDDLLGQQQVVIKSLEANFTRILGISGATILGNGSVSLILDIQGLINRFLQRIGQKARYKAA